jgi:hypothetical protein
MAAVSFLPLTANPNRFRAISASTSPVIGPEKTKTPAMPAF